MGIRSGERFKTGFRPSDDTRSGPLVRQTRPARGRRRASSRIDKSLLALPEPKRCATSNIYALWRSSPASFAAVIPATRTIFALRSRAGSDKRSAMNLRSRSAGRIIAELHRAGKERKWWSRNGLEPLKSARQPVDDDAPGQRRTRIVQISNGSRFDKSSGRSGKSASVLTGNHLAAAAIDGLTWFGTSISTSSVDTCLPLSILTMTFSGSSTICRS